MIKRLLIANRGEIAVRVIRACRELGIEAVAVYSQSDAESMAVDLADRAVCIGPAGPAARSYLDVRAVIAATQGTGCDAIHPGYGFLAENPDFVEQCEAAGLTFVGPRAASIRLMGDKVAARKTVSEAGVPVVPGSLEPIVDADEARTLAQEIGLPVMLKAKAGGGGRGIRVIRRLQDLAPGLSEATREAEAAFGDGDLYLERYLECVRHIEVQVLADGEGNTIHLGERDCSIQRRHQKLVEEAPSTAIDEALREELGATAVRVARSVDYVGAGTVEFLFDPEDRRFYFIEMNTRIQVEHPVTEVLTGVDLVAEQIRIASGATLSHNQSDIRLAGHAIECRINAEDPSKDFVPGPGVLHIYRAPGGPGVRVDTHCYQGYRVPPDYDSLLAKLIVHGRDRDQALRRMRRALSEFVIEGVPTTVPFHRALLEDEAFVSGSITTDFLQRGWGSNRQVVDA